MKERISEQLTRINEKIGNVFHYFESRMSLTVLLLFSVSIIIRFILTHFNSLLREDAHVYLLKAIEITQGNFIPIHTHAIGLSLFTSPIFYFFGGSSIFQNMVLAKIISVLIGASIIFPLYLILKKLTNKKITIIGLLLFTFYSSLISSATSFLSEPLFTFLFLFSIYFIIKSIEKKSYVSLSFLFAGLAYYVRPNGIFIFAILFFTFLFLHYKTIKINYKHLLIGVLIFWVVASPFLFDRHDAFGSAFTYGENDKYFVDSYHQVWSNNIETPSLSEYLTTHSFLEIFNKFVIHGFFKILFDFFHQMKPYAYSELISPLLIIFFFYGFLKELFNKSFIPLYFSFIIFIGGLSIVYSVFGTPRHLLALVPFITIFSAIGIYEIFKKNELNNILLSSFLVLFIIFSLISPVGLRFFTGTEMPSWGPWAANSIQGKIGIVEGGDLIMMNLPDTSVAGVGLLDLYAKKSNLSVTRPGYFENLESAMVYFKQIGMTHLALDESNIERRPYLKEVYLSKYNSWFSEIYSDKDSNEEWKMTIFKINWDKYERGIKNAN